MCILLHYTSYCTNYYTILAILVWYPILKCAVASLSHQYCQPPTHLPLLTPASRRPSGITVLSGVYCTTIVANFTV